MEKPRYNKGSSSKEKDQKLINYVTEGIPGCEPDLKRGNFGEDEDDLIIRLHALLGHRWSLIAGRLPGRTDDEIKNYWNSHLSLKLLQMGIDPNNHRLGQHTGTSTVEESQAENDQVHPDVNSRRNYNSNEDKEISSNPTYRLNH